MLEKGGACTWAYGVVGLKTHCKTSLGGAARSRRPEELRARGHWQLQPFDGAALHGPGIADVRSGDHGRCGEPLQLPDRAVAESASTNQLLVAPFAMRDGFVKLIDREIALAKAGGPIGGRIIAKMNSLEDKKITEKLYQASQAGREDHADRPRVSAACGRGSRGLSENINVISVVGRFLEHSRVFFPLAQARRTRWTARGTYRARTGCTGTSRRGSRRRCRSRTARPRRDCNA